MGDHEVVSAPQAIFRTSPLAVLGAVAQFERDVLRERTVAGMRAAKRRGERLGRRPALSPAQVREARAMLKRGENPTHVARVLRCGRSTLYRALQQGVSK